MIFGNNFTAPVRDLLSGSTVPNQIRKNSNGSSSDWILDDVTPPRILDVACGTGTWTLEMATEFPNCEFYGIDISASYPVDIKPANTFFSQCDILNGIPFSDDHFDFIFMRQVYSCFSESDWIVKYLIFFCKPKTLVILIVNIYRWL